MTMFTTETTELTALSVVPQFIADSDGHMFSTDGLRFVKHINRRIELHYSDSATIDLWYESEESAAAMFTKMAAAMTEQA